MMNKGNYSAVNTWHLLAYLIPVILISCQNRVKQEEWAVYGGGMDRQQYSVLDEIDTNNVKNLQVAWVYQTKDAGPSSQIQTNPLIVDGVLYGVSAKLKLFALDAASGTEKWVFDPSDSILMDNVGRTDYGLNVCRGLTLYRGDNNQRLLFYTAGPSLFCVDGETGKPVTTFGINGRISLHEGLDPNRELKDLRVTATSPGVIFRNTIIVGTSLSEEEEAAPGHIRAFDVHTGELKWLFRTIPAPGEIGYDTWKDPEAYRHVGGANAWGGFSLDEGRGVVYAATGTSNPDFYGGKRKGANLFANSILALDAATGAYKWHYQAIHHDLWDWDLPTAPVLVTVANNGEKTDAVAQVTKHGFIFLLNRDTGEPLHPIPEKAVPTDSELAGEEPAPTQPFPTVIPPFVRQSFSEADLNPYLPDSSFADIKSRFKNYKTGPMFTPPTERGTLVMPGLLGGAEWGGPSFDPETGILYINATEIPWVIKMTKMSAQPTAERAQTNLQAGKLLYKRNCSGCHGKDLEGSSNFPSLRDLEKRFSPVDFADLVTNGRRMMPAFKHFGASETRALATYLLKIAEEQTKPFVPTVKERNKFYDSPYRLHSITQFLSEEGYPAISPPWGTLSAISLNTGDIVWKRPLGEVPELAAKGIATGTENIGGSVVTAGGLVFIAATKDERFRAFNKNTGQLLFETALPAGGYATPAIYAVNGKQYVVIASGGGKMGTPSGDAYVAFSLPD